MDTDRAKHPGFVYVVQAAGQDVVKIGWSRRPVERAAQLQAGAGGLPMSLLAFFIGSLEAEAALHARFDAWRVDGAREWFRIGGEVEAWLRALQHPQVTPDRPLWRFEAPAADRGGDEPASEFRLSMARFNDWFHLHVEPVPGQREMAGNYYWSYQRYCTAMGYPALTNRAFGDALRASGVIRSGKDASGRVIRIGGRLHAAGIVREQSNLRRPGTPTGEGGGND